MNPQTSPLMKEQPLSPSEMSPMFGPESIYYRNIFLDPTPYYAIEETSESRAIQRQVNLIFVSLCILIGVCTMAMHAIKNAQPIPDRAILDLKINKYPV